MGVQQLIARCTSNTNANLCVGCTFTELMTRRSPDLRGKEHAGSREQRAGSRPGLAFAFRWPAVVAHEVGDSF